MQGTLRIILDPLLVEKPFVGAVTVFFLQKPVSPVEARQACCSLGVSTCLLGPRHWLEPRMEAAQAHPDQGAPHTCPVYSKAA